MKRNHRKKVSTIILSIVMALAITMTGCSASKTDAELWNNAENIISAESLEDNTDYSKFDDEEKGTEEKSTKDKNAEEKNAEPEKGVKADNKKNDMAPGKEEPSKESKEEPKKKSCTISISCATILSNMDSLKEGKESVVPSGGVILGSTGVEINDGDTVFDVLSKVVRQKGIHMEYTNTPGYNSVYVEGIANIYERDCGPASGWQYAVNGTYPGYGSSQYEVKDGDVIAWNYTCDLGNDL